MEENKFNILVIDDEIDNLQLFVRTFRKKYNVLVANSGNEAIEILLNNKIDVIISDHKMPEMQGVELLKKALLLSPESIRILITAYTDANSVMNAINEAKIYRYIRKPWSPVDLNNIVDSALEVHKLNKDNQKLVGDLKELFSGTIMAITAALDAKDSSTYGRSKRVTFFAMEIGSRLGLTDTQLNELELSGLLHDIGMIGVPECILAKNDRLTEDEYSLVKKHVTYGVKILEEIKQLESILKIVELHHERFDGSGYPYGLSGEEIPIQSRIIAVVDSYDSLTTDKPYRRAVSHEEAIKTLTESYHGKFDPVILNIFTSFIDDLRFKFKK